MPPTVDAEAVLAREQAAAACALWGAGDFDATQQTLQRVEASLPSDARVQLNLWVAGYYADASTSLDSVAKELEAWLKAHPSDPADTSQQNTHAVAAVNYGLILFLQQQHASALSVLEPLFDIVDILQDGTALCLCVLLLEIYLDSCQLPKAVESLQYLQGLCPPPGLGGLAGQDGPAAAAAGEAGSSSSSGHGQQPTPANRSPQRQQRQDGQGDAGGSPKKGSAGQATAQQPAAGGQQQGAGVPLSQALPTMSKTKGQQMGEVFQLVQQQGGQAPGQDLAPLLHLYKARLALACHNHKAAKKEVRGLLSSEPDSPAALLLKAQLETSRQQPRKALKTLAPLLAAQQHNTLRCRLELLNLLAAVHHQLDKHHVSALYLTTALNLHAEAQQQQNPQPPPASRETQQQRKQQGKQRQKKQQQGKAAATEAAAAAAPPQTSSSGGADADAAAVVARQSRWLLPDMSDALSYNLGLQQLALQDWQAALECFEAASSKYCTLPHLWLRWAEACLGLYHQQQQQQAGISQQGGAGSSGGGSAAPSGKGKGGKQGKGQAQSKKQQQQQQQQQGISCEQLLQQAAAHISTGLVLLQEHQAAAAKQLDAATAAAAAAIAAGEPPPDLVGQPWPALPASAAGVDDGIAAAAAASSSSAGALGLSSAAAAGADAGGAGGSTPTVAAAGEPVAAFPGPGGLVHSPAGWPPESALLAPELAAVKQSLLSNKAFVALLQGQPEAALSASQELVACSSMSPQQHYLGTSYAAEALCLLGRGGEARQLMQGHMELFMINSTAGGLPGAPSSQPQQQQQQHQGVPGSSADPPRAAGTANTVAAASRAHAPPGSTKSFDGSCVSCSRGVCGHSGGLGVSGAGAGVGPKATADLLHNMGAVLMLQGDYQEAHRHAAIAAAVDRGQLDPLAGAQLVAASQGPLSHMG